MKLLQPTSEDIGVHVSRIIFVAESAQLFSQPVIINSVRCQLFCQFCFIELRISSRVREATDVRKALNVAVMQQRLEDLYRPIGMTDRVNFFIVK